MVLHGAAIAALFNVSNPAVEPDAHLENGRPTEIRIRGKLYYVAQLDGSRSGSSGSPLPNHQPQKTKSPAEGRSGGIAAPRAAAAGRSPRPARAALPAPEPSPAPAPAAPRVPAPVASPAVAANTPSQPNPALQPNPAPAPTPEKIRPLRQEARAFIPPEVRPTPRATQTLIQPLSPPNLAPPATPLPNFRVFTDLKQMRKIPKPFQAPGRRTPPTPAQAPDIATPALELVPQPPAPVGDPLTVLSMNDHPIPFSDKVVVPPGNIAQPQHESSGPVAASGTTPGTSTAGSGAAPSASSAPSASAGANGGGPAASALNGDSGSNGASAPNGVSATNGGGASNGGSAPNGAAPGNGRAAVGYGTGAALVGGSPDGNLLAVVGGNGASPGSKGAGMGANGLGMNGPGIGSSEASGTGSAGTGAGTGVGSGAGAGRSAPGSLTINRPPAGTFDAVVVQSSPVDQYPESRGLLSGRPIYSVYISMGTARDWTLFFCVPGEKPQSGNGPVVVLGPLGAPVKAPFPTKLLKPAIKLPSYEKYVLVHGLVNKDGKFEGLRLVRPIRPETDQALLAALANWEFRAATRDGVAIAVEFLLSIPATGL